MYTFVKGAPNWVEPLNENFAEVAALAEAAVPASEKGAAGGVATLDSDGKLAQMPTAEDVGAAALVATTALEVGTDLDALTTPGTYLIPNNNVAATLLHAPAAKAGKVIVSDVTSTETYTLWANCTRGPERGERRRGRGPSGCRKRRSRARTWPRRPRPPRRPPTPTGR